MRLSALYIAVLLMVFSLVPSAIFSQLVSAEEPSAYQEYLVDQEILFGDKNATAVPQCAPGAGVISGSAVATNFSLGTSEVERRTNLIKALMSDYGLTAEQAAGIVGNFMHESGGKHLPPNINEGGSAGPPRFSGGYGWAQWTGGRQRSFIQYAVDNKYMVSQTVDATDAANYAYLKHELDTGYKVTITDLKKQTTPEDAAVSFEATFEKAGVPALEPRKTNARQAFTELSTTLTPGSGATGGCTQAGGATIIGNVAFPLTGTKAVVKNPEIFKNGTTNQGGHPYIAYDILADVGTPVVAFMSGTVIGTGEDRCPGRMVSIYNQESNLTISYLHLSMNGAIGKGTVVKPGDRVGVVGIGTADAGCKTPHLHIDAVQGNKRVGCSRNNCPESNQRLFRDIGPQLFNAFQAMPN